MAPEHPDVAKVQLLLSALFLARTSPREGVLGDAPLRWVSEWLGLGPADHFGEDALRHLVAIQLAPTSAIDYDRTSPTPRWKLVDEYLEDRFALPGEERTPIARLVASILDRASTKRGSELIGPEGAYECAICRLPFLTEPLSVSTRDPYKPTWHAPQELCRPDADHIVPISGLGKHDTGNLQVVCRACNLAKGSGLIIDPDAEIRHSGLSATEVPRIHLFRLLQWLIRRCDGRCSYCGSGTGELTMRIVHPDAPIARATLSLTCYACVVP
ncbi:MAG: HNH endonuclease [Actinomycetota bacterium]|nr:HNH endonuclease [Actinomycetota bacterium]